MREKETESSLGARYMSPLVKQDLARLDKDGESRRSAMNSLKQFVEHLDPGSMPRFLAQVSETRDQGQSRSYAISLYEEVARVHGKLIIPHIPRVMGILTKSLSSSGSSPQLHQACAKVVSAVARYSLDGESSPGEADLILRQLCEPLLDVLAGKLEPLAAGAAVCLQALVECDKWKYASDDVVKDACLRTTVALGERTNRTVAHMQLARSLASTNPSFVNSFGVSLLRTGSEVLRQNPASGTWQQRACAARLLQAVLPTVDSATLASELEHTVQALDDCKHDRMAHVRTAVSDALKTAKMLTSDEKYRLSSDGEDPLPGTSPLSSFAIEKKQQKKHSSEMKTTSSTGSESKYGSSPVAGSEESMMDTFFSHVSPGSQISAEASPSLYNSRRSPPLRTRLTSGVCSSQSSSVMSVDDLDNCLNPGRSCEAQAKEDVPSRNPDVYAGASCGFGSAFCTGQVGKHARSRSSTPEFKLFYPPSLGDRMGTDQHGRDIEGVPRGMLKRRGRSFSSLENSVMTVDRIQEGGDLVDDGDISLNIPAVDSQREASLDSNNGRLPSKQNIDKRVGKDLRSGEACRFSECGILSNETMKHAFEVERSGLQRMSRSVDSPSLDDCFSARSEAVEICHYDETFKSVCERDSTYNSSPPSGCLEDFSTPQVAAQKSRALITAEDFLPYNTPRRMVRSLQSKLSSSSGASSEGDLDTKIGEEGIDMPDMDLETCSEAGWSVRDNPIASDESFKADNKMEDKEQGGKASRKMLIDSSPRNHFAVVKKETGFAQECDRISIALLHVAETLLCVNSSKTVEPECLEKGFTMDNVSGPPLHPQGSFDSLPGEDGLFECFRDDKASSKEQFLECGPYLLQHNEDKDRLLPLEKCRDRALGLFLIRLYHSLTDIFGNSFRNFWACAEALLGGFLLIILAIPLAMVLSKILWSSDHFELIPT